MPKHDWTEASLSYDETGSLREGPGYALSDEILEDAANIMRKQFPTMSESVIRKSMKDLKAKSLPRKGYVCRTCDSKSLKGGAGYCKKINVVKSVLSS